MLVCDAITPFFISIYALVVDQVRHPAITIAREISYFIWSRETFMLYFVWIPLASAWWKYLRDCDYSKIVSSSSLYWITSDIVFERSGGYWLLMCPDREVFTLRMIYWQWYDVWGVRLFFEITINIYIQTCFPNNFVSRTFLYTVLRIWLHTALSLPLVVLSLHKMVTY